MLAAIDEEIGKVASDGVDDATLARVKTKMLADWYGGLESFLGRADTLAKLQTLWGDANVANQMPGWIEAVTSDDIQRVARTYLTDANRSVIVRRPAPQRPPPLPPPSHPPSEDRHEDEHDIQDAGPRARPGARRHRPGRHRRCRRTCRLRPGQAAAGPADRQAHPVERARPCGWCRATACPRSTWRWPCSAAPRPTTRPRRRFAS